MQSEIPRHLHWACRRGMLELDVLLGNFLKEAFMNAPLETQHLFVDLLNYPDQDLYGWLMGNAVPDDPRLVTITEKVRQHARDRTHFHQAV